MKKKFHINKNGDVKPCGATTRACPVSKDHYPTMDAAWAAYEGQQKALQDQPSPQDLSPEGLRDSVREYRDPTSTEEERDYIRAVWKDMGVKNQFSAMLRAAEMEKEAAAAEALDQNWDYDLEEMSVMNRMKTVLKTKHGWDDGDFEGMTFTDVESEFLDGAGEPDFRPSDKQMRDETIARDEIDFLSNVVARQKENNGPALEHHVYRAAKNFQAILETDEYFMGHKPKARAALAEKIGGLLSELKVEEPQRVRSKKITERELDELYGTLNERRFFQNERQLNEKLWDVKEKQGEHWISNGVVDFKIFNRGAGLYEIYNFKNLQHRDLDDIFQD